MLPDIDRRHFLATSAAALAAPSASAAGPDKPASPALLRVKPPRNPERPKRRLAVITSVFRFLSHSYHICGRFFDGYLRGGAVHYPDWHIASMFVDQPKDPSDLSRDYAKDYGFTLSPNIASALTLGGDKLAVDGVLLICEHGDYARNDRGQILYPRYEMYQQVVDVFRKSGRSVPVFVDKHLSYDRRRAFEMVDTARKLGFPLMAGSSLPVTWRRPELELPIGVRVREALIAGSSHSEVYGIHALESLQCMVERRRRGQQGLRAVQTLVGAEVWKAGDAGLWSWELLDHAVGRSNSRNCGDIRRNCRVYKEEVGKRVFTGPTAFLLEYRDGLRAAVLMLQGHVGDMTFAARIEGEKRPASTLFLLPPPPGAAFLEAQAMKIEAFLEGRPPYPVERTLLTTGILDAALESRQRDSRRIETPDLDVSYDPPKDSGFMRGEYAAPAP
jgi:hypothetical protein